MRFPEVLDRDVLTRLRRIEGQVRGLQRLVTEGAECREIVTQLAATGAALDRVGFKLMAAGLRECAAADGDIDAAELENLFLKLA